MPPHLKKSINQAHLLNGTYEQIVTQLERELELNSFESLDETQMKTATHKHQIERNKDNAGNINSDTNDSSPNKYEFDRKSRTVYPPCETCGKTNHSAETCFFWSQGSKQATPLEEQTSTTGRTGQYNWLFPCYSPTSQLEISHFHYGTVTDGPQTSGRIFHQSHVLSGSNLWRYLCRVQVS